MIQSERIQADTKAFRSEVSSWSDEKLREEGAARGVPDYESLDKTTLREAIVQHYRDGLRDEVHGTPILPDRPSKLGS